MIDFWATNLLIAEEHTEHPLPDLKYTYNVPPQKYGAPPVVEVPQFVPEKKKKPVIKKPKIKKRDEITKYTYK